MINVGIIGGSGYTGMELIRMLLKHPKVNIKIVTSRRFSGKKINEVYPQFKSICNLVFDDVNTSKVAEEQDVVFTAVPHGTATDYVPELMDCGVKVIDLSADYRLSEKAVYGLCELHPEVSNADLVANPGCYPTGAILAVAPLIDKKIVSQVIFDSKSGISGAGAEPTEISHYPNLAENVIPYKITNHRHKPEIVKEVERLHKNVKISFTPHVIPAMRGILTTAHVFLKSPKLEAEDIKEIYDKFYKDKPFIRLYTIPSLHNTRGSNFCDIGFELEEKTDRLVVISAIDNLVKGASGQAIQNMNLMFGLDEKEGLWTGGFFP